MHFCKTVKKFKVDSRTKKIALIHSFLGKSKPGQIRKRDGKTLIIKIDREKQKK